MGLRPCRGSGSCGMPCCCYHPYSNQFGQESSAAGSLSTHLNSRLAAVKAPSNQAARQDFLYRPAGSFLYSIPIGCYATLRSGFSDFLTQKFTPLSMYRYKTNAHNTVPGMHTIQSQCTQYSPRNSQLPSC